MKNSDRAVAKVLLTAFDSGLGCTKLSNAEISVRSGLSTSTVQTSLKLLIAAGYFRSIAPSREEWRDSDHTLKYEPQFDCRNRQLGYRTRMRALITSERPWTLRCLQRSRKRTSWIDLTTAVLCHLRK